MVGRPAHSVAPPLVGHFMRSYLLDETGELAVDISEQHPALGRIRIGRDRKINQVGPRLTEIKIRLFGDVDFLIRYLAKIKVAQLQLGAGLFENVFRHGPGRHGLQRARKAQVAGQLFQVIAGNLVAGYFIGQVHLFVFAVIESCNSHRVRRDPVADRKVLLNRFSLQFTNADDFIFFRHLEGEIVKSVFAKTIQVGIPRSASADVVTSFSGFL